MLRINRAMEVHYKKCTQNDWDCVGIISGDEGYSKSTLGLHLLDWWYRKQNGAVKPGDIKHVALNGAQFTEDLDTIKKKEMIVFDEAGELSNRRAMSKFNFVITQAYQVIRGLNLFTVFIVPSVFDLDPFFTKRRARFLIHIGKRGELHYWNKERLRKLIAVNADRKYKHVWRIKSLFPDKYPKYRGILADPYDKKKNERMKEIRTILKEKMKEATIGSERDKIIGLMKTKGLSDRVISEYVGLSRGRVSEILRDRGDGRGEGSILNCTEGEKSGESI